MFTLMHHDNKYLLVMKYKILYGISVPIRRIQHRMPDRYLLLYSVFFALQVNI